MDLIFLLTCWLAVQSNSNHTTIVFSELEYTEVLAQAKAENKPVFLYFHFNGCGGCIQMEKTALINRKVVDLLNKKFICYNVNISEPEGAAVNKIYFIRGFPTFLFLDPDGKRKSEIIGIRKPDEFYEELKRVTEII